MFLRFNLLTILWAVVILVLILLPSQDLPKIEGETLISFDKLAHGGVFFILVFLMIIGFIKQSTYPKLRHSAIKYALTISICYSLVLEGAQLLSEGRMVDLYDGIANIIGCVSGFVFFCVVYRL